MKSDPDCTIELRGETKQMRATITEGDERTALYGRFKEMEARFVGYEKKTSRTIPVVRLSPQ